MTFKKPHYNLALENTEQKKTGTLAKNHDKSGIWETSLREHSAGVSNAGNAECLGE